jgi:hypothetical protein
MDRIRGIRIRITTFVSDTLWWRWPGAYSYQASGAMRTLVS